MNNRKNRQNNAFNIKDYIVPISIFILIFILIYIAFSWGENKNNEKTENIENSNIENSIEINFWNESTNVEITALNNEKRTIKSGDNLNPWEGLFVKEWNILFNIQDKADLSLDKNGKILYKKNSKIKLESSSLWINTNSILDIEMKFAKVNIGENSIVNLEQNEWSSTIYLLSGKVEVINNWGMSTYLSPRKKIIISNKNAYSKELDMNLQIQDFDDFFKISPWFLKNNGSVFLNISDDNENISEAESFTEEEIDENNVITNTSGLLKFNNIYDEWSVSSSSTNISWEFTDERIKKITINNKEAVINIDNKTFNVLDVNTSKKSNDIIIKIFDKEDTILSKYVYILYNNSKIQIDNLNNSYSKINIAPFPVKSSDFIISIPTVKNWKTTSNENTFFGTVKNPNVKSVTINGYKLKTFNWKTFRYHAHKRFWNLWYWINNYEIKYFDWNWDIILKKYVTIDKIKKEQNKKISWEANLSN